MAIEQTLSIIKPNSVKDRNIGNIIAHLERENFTVKELRMIQMTKEQAEGFYAEHSERPFFGELVGFMTSGPVVVIKLEGDNAIARYREVMGATNPANAAEGTLRKLYAKSFTENAVHGSDSQASAQRELKFFFN